MLRFDYWTIDTWQTLLTGSLKMLLHQLGHSSKRYTELAFKTALYNYNESCFTCGRFQVYSDQKSHRICTMI